MTHLRAVISSNSSFCSNVCGHLLPLSIQSNRLGWNYSIFPLHLCNGRCSVAERVTRVKQRLEIRGCCASWICDRTRMLPCFYCSLVASLINANAIEATQAYLELIFELSYPGTHIYCRWHLKEIDSLSVVWADVFFTLVKYHTRALSISSPPLFIWRV